MVYGYSWTHCTALDVQVIVSYFSSKSRRPTLERTALFPFFSLYLFNSPGALVFYFCSFPTARRGWVWSAQIMVQVFTPIADRYGTYRLMMWAATFKLVAGSLMFCTAGRMWPLWALLFLGNRLAQTVWGFYNLSFSDVRPGARERW